MAQFNPNKIKAYTDFLKLQNDLKLAQTSYENAKVIEQVTDTVFGMGLATGAEAYKLHIRSRNRKLLLVGALLAGGAYLYNKNKKVEDDVLSSRKNGYVDYSRRPKKRSNRTSKEVKYYEK